MVDITGKDYKLGSDAYAIFVCVFASMGGAFFGYDQGVTGGILVMDSFLEDFCVGWDGLTYHDCSASSNNLPEKWATFTSNFSLVYYIGCVFGAFFAHLFCDNYGRRITIFMASLFFCSGTLWCVLAETRELVLVARVLAGLGVGSASFCLPIFAAEAAPTRWRGALSSFMQMTVVLGLLWAGIMNVVFEHSDEGWRWSLGIALIIPTVLMIGVFCLPESPRWLYAARSREDAEIALMRLRGGNVEAELEDIRWALEAENAEGESGWNEVVGKKVRSRTLIAITLQIFQQLTGINAMFVYGGIIFKDVIGDGVLALLILQIVNVVATVPELFLVDRLGRRSLLLWGAIAMSVAMGASGLIGITCDEKKNPDTGDTEIHCNDLAGGFMLATVGCFIAAFALSWGPICWVYPAEIFPLNIRGKAVALSTTANWGMGALIVTTNQLIPYIHIYGLFFLFSGFSIIGWVFVYFNCPETKGLPLEAINALFGDHVDPTKGHDEEYGKMDTVQEDKNGGSDEQEESQEVQLQALNKTTSTDEAGNASGRLLSKSGSINASSPIKRTTSTPTGTFLIAKTASGNLH